MAGIKETEELVTFVVSLANALHSAMEDGMSWEDSFKLLPVLTKLPKAVEGYEQIPQELIDLDDQELDTLLADIDKLDFVQQNKIAILNQALMTGADLVKLVALIRDAKKAGGE